MTKMTPILESKIACPQCGHNTVEKIPEEF